MNEYIETQWLENPKRGPGGNWYRYKATKPGESKVGYGTTEREARMDLRKQISNE